MSRSLSYLRRGLLGIACVASLGFGATQAFASPGPATLRAENTCWYCECDSSSCICIEVPCGG